MVIAEAAALRVLAKPLTDLYNLAVEKSIKKVTKAKNVAAIRKLTERVRSVEKVKTFWQLDKEVALSSFYYPSRVSIGSPQRKTVKSLVDFPKPHNYVIQGTVGQGKSIFLRYLCIQELTPEGSGRIPIFIELRTITEGGLRQSIEHALDTMGFHVDKELFELYASSGKLVLLLDAFDELTEALVPSVVAEIERMAEKYEAMQFFVTSRPQSAIQNSRHFRVAQLAPLSRLDHAPFLSKIGVSSTDSKRLLEVVGSSRSNVSGILTTPLMLTLLVLVYRSGQVIPTEVPDFYDRLFQTLFSKHDSSKPGFVRAHKSGLGERSLQHLFEAFCFCTLQQRRQRTLTTQEFDRYFAAALKHVDFQCAIEGFKHDITRVACLMQEEDYNYHFIHKSVMEFYAASFIRNRTTDAAQRFYGSVAEGNWWSWLQVLKFLAEIDKYRYFRFLGIKSIENTCELLAIDPKHPDQIRARDILDTTYFDVDGHFTIEDSSNTYTFGSPAYEIGPTEQIFDLLHPVIAALFKKVNDEEELSKAEAQRRYPNSRWEEDKGFLVSWRDILNEKEKDDLARRLQDRLVTMIGRLTEMRQFVALEDQRAALLVI